MNILNDISTNDFGLKSEMATFKEQKTESIIDKVPEELESIPIIDTDKISPEIEMIVENKAVSAEINDDKITKEDNTVDFKISFTKENLELAGENALYEKFSKFSNDIFTKIFQGNKIEDITGEFLLDSETGVPTNDKMKWESAYALQQLNFGINSNHIKFIQRDIKNCEYTYYYDSNGDGNFEHIIGFDKDNNTIFIKLVNKNEKFKQIISIENIKNECLKIITNKGEIVENIADCHFMQAGFNKVQIIYDENGKVKNMECIEELKEEPSSMLESSNISPACVLSSDMIEIPVNIEDKNETEDDLASLAKELNSIKSTEIDIIE